MTSPEVSGSPPSYAAFFPAPHSQGFALYKPGGANAPMDVSAMGTAPLAVSNTVMPVDLAHEDIRIETEPS